MAAYWDTDGLEYLVKMFAGLEAPLNYELISSMTYDPGDFTWPDETTTRSVNSVTSIRTPSCVTGGIIDRTQLNIYGGSPTSKIEDLVWGAWFVLEGDILSGVVASIETTIEFTR